MTNQKKPPQALTSITLCAGVDVMADRLVVSVCAFGPLVQPLAFHYRTIICGDPALDQVWQALWSLLQEPVSCPGGELLAITAAAIDSGGHHTQQVYGFVLDHAPLCPMRLFAIKGAVLRQKSPLPIKSAWVDVSRAGRIIGSALELFFVDIQAVKALLASRMLTDASLVSGPCACALAGALLLVGQDNPITRFQASSGSAVTV